MRHLQRSSSYNIPFQYYIGHTTSEEAEELQDLVWSFVSDNSRLDIKISIFRPSSCLQRVQSYSVYALEVKAVDLDTLSGNQLFFVIIPSIWGTQFVG